jgi:hypothetical protein
LDSEADAQAQVVAHVLEAFIADHVRKAVFIVQSDTVAKKVANIVEVVIGILEDLSDYTMDTKVQFFQTIVSPRTARSRRKLRNALIEGCKDAGISVG